MQKITVIIPIYNAKKYIIQLTDCLNRQIFSYFTVVFVDDCSADDSVKALKNALQNVRYPYQIISLSKNSGAGAARNIGMRYVNTPYFCFIDADDSISENYLHALYEKALETNADIVFSDFVRHWENGKEVNTRNLEKIRRHIDDSRYTVACADFGPVAKLIATALWDEETCGFPENIRGEDAATIPVLYAMARSFATCEDAIYYYYQTQNSRSRSIGNHYLDPLKAWTILSGRIADQEILEYKYMMAVGYIVIRNAIRYGVSRKEVLSYCRELKDRYPSCLRNRFFRANTIWQKKVFVFCAYHKFTLLLKLMVKAVG